MDIKKVVRSQYLASLEMLGEAIACCPDSLWTASEPKNTFWHIAYHALFYAHLYLQRSEKEFEPWKKHRDEYQFMGPVPWPPHNKPAIGAAYSKREIMEYLAFCKEEVKTVLPVLDLESEESGFSWLPFNKMELQLYNIRHIQQHTGELCERLGIEANIDINWIGMVHE